MLFRQKRFRNLSAFGASQKNSIPVDEGDEWSPRVALARVLAAPAPGADGYAGADHRIGYLAAVVAAFVSIDDRNICLWRSGRNCVIWL